MHGGVLVHHEVQHQADDISLHQELTECVVRHYVLQEVKVLVGLVPVLGDLTIQLFQQPLQKGYHIGREVASVDMLASQQHHFIEEFHLHPELFGAVQQVKDTEAFLQELQGLTRNVFQQFAQFINQACIHFQLCANVEHHIHQIAVAYFVQACHLLRKFTIEIGLIVRQVRMGKLPHKLHDEAAQLLAQIHIFLQQQIIVLDYIEPVFVDHRLN